MKKMWLLPLLAVLLAGCKSREEKVADLIKDNMFKTLYDFSSYEPIETTIDSAFSSVYTDSVIMSDAYRAKFNLKEARAHMDKVRSAHDIMEIWGGGYYSSYGTSKYREAKKDAEENLTKSKELMAIVDSLYNRIKERASTITKEFTGWQSVHKFRCKNKGGNYGLGEYLYIFDEDITKINLIQDLDDEDYKSIQSLIDEAINTDKEEGSDKS